jgi:hypothetical protein
VCHQRCSKRARGVGSDVQCATQLARSGTAAGTMEVWWRARVALAARRSAPVPPVATRRARVPPAVARSAPVASAVMWWAPVALGFTWRAQCSAAESTIDQARAPCRLHTPRVLGGGLRGRAPAASTWVRRDSQGANHRLGAAVALKDALGGNTGNSGAAHAGHMATQATQKIAIRPAARRLAPAASRITHAHPHAGRLHSPAG